MRYPTLWRQSPARVWDDLFTTNRAFDRLVQQFFAPSNGEPVSWAPAVDVTEDDQAVKLQVELPGVNPADVNITVANGVLTISGEKKSDREDKQDTVQFVERWYGRFQRSFTLPGSVNAEKVKADFTNGVLTVTLPKSEMARARRIEVTAGSSK